MRGLAAKPKRALQKNFCCEVHISNWDLVGPGGYVGEAW